MARERASRTDDKSTDCSTTLPLEFFSQPTAAAAAADDDDDDADDNRTLSMKDWAPR